MSARETFLIVGASARAAAASLVQSGFAAESADLFADADLALLGPVQCLENFAALKQFSPSLNVNGWLYTGGMENEPDIVELFSQRIPLLGNGASVLRAVRNVERLHSVLEAHHYCMPDMLAELPLQPSGQWLRKSARSAGGTKVGWATASPADSSLDGYFQQFIRGRCCGAIFLADVEQTHLLGITEQLLNVPWTHAPGFFYAGSVGPIRLSDPIEQQLMRLGNVLRTEFHLQGWFGVDFILDAEEKLWILEVNPRYPASLETCERTAQCCTARWHVEACRGGVIPAAAVADFRNVNHYWGKAILYAPTQVNLAPETLSNWLRQSREENDLADVPSQATTIPPEMPLVTILASGANREDVFLQLQAKSNRFFRCLPHAD